MNLNQFWGFSVELCNRSQLDLSINQPILPQHNIPDPIQIWIWITLTEHNPSSISKDIAHNPTTGGVSKVLGIDGFEPEAVFWIRDLYWWGLEYFLDLGLVGYLDLAVWRRLRIWDNRTYIATLCLCVWICQLINGYCVSFDCTDSWLDHSYLDTNGRSIPSINRINRRYLFASNRDISLCHATPRVKHLDTSRTKHTHWISSGEVSRKHTADNLTTCSECNLFLS